MKTGSSNRVFLAIILILFPVTFLSSCILISLTPFAYYHERANSCPPLEGSSNLFPVGIFGPSPNSTEVPLDTAVVIFLMRPVNIENFSLTPQGPLAIQTIEHSPPASETYTFCFAEPLKPVTTYNITLLAGGKPVTWNFTTTAKPYSARFNTYLCPSVPWVALAIATSITFGVTLVVWHKKRKTLEA